MTPEELNTASYHKMEAEQDSYRDWLLTLPPDEILSTLMSTPCGRIFYLPWRIWSCSLSSAGH